MKKLSRGQLADDRLLRLSVYMGAFSLAATSFVARRSALNPSSIWLDDAWLALGARLPWSDIPDVGLTALGFAALVKISGSLFGPSSLAFQALPFLLGVSMAPATFLVLRRYGHGLLGAATSMLVVWAPVHVTYSSRVKQYTLEGVAGLLLLYLAIGLLDELDNRRCWALISGASIAAIVLSTSMIVIVVSWCGAVGIAVLLDNRRRQLLGLAGPWIAVLGVFTLAYWAILIRPGISQQVQDFWNDQYLPTDDGLNRFLQQLRIQLGLVVEQMFSLRPVRALKLLLLGSALILVIRRRFVALLLVLPVVLTAVLAALEMAPLGGGRTDSHLLPALLLLVGLAASEVASAIEERWNRNTMPFQALVLIAVALWAFADRVPGPAYPIQDIRPVVAELNDRRTSQEWVLIYYSSAWAYGMYTSTGVFVAPDDPALDSAIYQPGYVDPRHVLMGQRRSKPEEYGIWVEEVTADGEPVWFVSSHVFGDEQSIIGQLLLDERYHLVDEVPASGALLQLWEPIP